MINSNNINWISHQTLIWSRHFLFAMHVPSQGSKRSCISCIYVLGEWSLRLFLRFFFSSVLMRFLCKTSHKDSCAGPCLTWHCQPIKSAEYNQRETAIVSDWKPYLQQYTKIIKTPTLQTDFSYIVSKLKRTRNQMTSDIYVLNWKSSYDVMLLMYQRRQQYFAEF